MRRGGVWYVAFAAALVASVAPAAEKGDRDRREEVASVERAFAQTMADRDLEGFTAHLSEEAIFISGLTVSRGKAAVVELWKTYFEGPVAPFSWEPETVEVLESGDLALSSGPVRDPQGTLVARFNSVWRQEEPGVWRVVFDRGSQVCPPKASDP